MMARQTFTLSSRHILWLIVLCFTTFLIQPNESLIPAWCTRCFKNQPVSTSHNEKSRTTFFRPNKSSTAVGSGSGGSGDSDASSTDSDSHHEAPNIFFADKDTDTSDNINDEDEKIRLEEESHLVEEKNIAEQKAEKERSLEEARLSKERLMKVEEEVRLLEEQRESQFREWREKAVESVENVIKPLSEIQDGVPSERIKGAAIAATALTLLASKGVLASSAVGLSAAYLSISKSIAGDFLRTVGGITWDATETASKLADQLGVIPNFGEVNRTVVNKYKQKKPIIVGSEVDEGELAFIEAEDDDDLARILKEAECVIGEADAAIAKVEADQKEKVKQSIEEELKTIAENAEIKEQEKIADIAKEEKARVAEEDRIAEEAKEEGRIAEDRIVEEAKRKAEEEEKARIVEEGRIAEEAKLKAEEKARIAEDDRIAKEARLKVEEVARIAEEERIVEEAKPKLKDEEKEDGDILFDDDQFMAAVELAQEGIEGKIVGVDDIISNNSAKAEWDAAGILANELRQDTDTSFEADVDDEDDDFALGDIDLEALGRAAREAVEVFESDVEKSHEAVLDQKQQWVHSMVENDEDDDEDDNFDFGTDEDLFSSDNLDEIARAARAAVEAGDNNVIDKDSIPSEAIVAEIVSKDWSSLNVVQLKEELKKRGLKTSGRKADLVSLLEKSDLEISDRKNENGASALLDGGDEEIIELEDFDIEELGRQARAAVEMFQTTGGDFDEEPTEEMLAELESEMTINGEFLEDPKPSIDISKMTVAQLKEECRNRGFKVGGRKAELIERLEN